MANPLIGQHLTVGIPGARHQTHTWVLLGKIIIIIIIIIVVVVVVVIIIIILLLLLL